jgi:hypothetical protein
MTGGGSCSGNILAEGAVRNTAGGEVPDLKVGGGRDGGGSSEESGGGELHFGGVVRIGVVVWVSC